MSNNRVRNVIFCDDIRTENNGKLIAIGIYSDNMSVPSFPFNGTMSFLIAVDMSDVEESVFIHFDFIPASEIRSKVELRFEVGILPNAIRRNNVILFPSPQLPFSIADEGYMMFREKSEAGEILQEFRIFIGRAPLAVVSQERS